MQSAAKKTKALQDAANDKSLTELEQRTQAGWREAAIERGRRGSFDVFFLVESSPQETPHWLVLGGSGI